MHGGAGKELVRMLGKENLKDEILLSQQLELFSAAHNGVDAKELQFQIAMKTTIKISLSVYVVP